MTGKKTAMLCWTMLFLACFVFAANPGDGRWLNKVPPRDRAKQNPYQQQSDAVLAGRRIFVDHCSHCHGENAQGSRKRPALVSARIQDEATEGDLHWLLVNGSMAHGMPSWSKLGDPQIWEIISYLKSLHR
jgi:mono/diheme cytochrome c family protein